MYNVVLAAGSGKRFKKYKLPKPLIEVNNMPMIVNAAKSLPKKNKYIFLLKKSHTVKYPYLKRKIKKHFKNSKNIILKKKTSGQASSLNKIKNYVDKKVPFFVTSTDFAFKYNKEKLNYYLQKKKNIIFVCKPTKYMKLNYNQFGWVRHDNKFNIVNISCKKKIRGNNLNDKVILGAFVFNSFNTFSLGFNKMKKLKKKINNEYYIDILFKILIKFYKVKSITVNKFINWGTPEEYQKNKNKRIYE